MSGTIPKLSDVFTAVAVKQLTAVDLPSGTSKVKQPVSRPSRSNQHEINGSAPLRDFFRVSEKIHGEIHWYIFSDDQGSIGEPGSFTFYDSRIGNPSRSAEWRFYYTGEFLSQASAGDTLVLARDHNNRIHGLVFAQGSSWLRAASVLFDFSEGGRRFQLFEAPALEQRSLALVRQQILDELGIEVVLPTLPNDEDLVTERFGMEFPSTREMSELARSLVRTDDLDDDALLVAWIERELQLFTALERSIVWQKIQKGFDSVEDFLAYSKSVQNRRKSRMGHALENHLEALFTRNSLRFQRGVVTEGKNKPDFLFPGSAEYHDPAFKAALLIMLGAKSTLKDRWRQVLTEANRIRRKHLCTLETAISVDQTEEIQRSRVTLVIPASLHETYTAEQQRNLLSITEFIEHVRRKQ